MPFIRKVHVLFKTRLIFSRINGPIVLADCSRMIDKRQKATKAKWKRDESLTKQSIL